MSRSSYWEEVRAVVAQSRRARDRFDPDEDARSDCIERGVRPIVALYLRARRDGTDLTDVECSLLSSLLNDWLSLYAETVGVHLDADFTVHEVSMTYAGADSLYRTISDLTNLPTCRSRR
jgi:hypothetical protein